MDVWQIRTPRTGSRRLLTGDGRRKEDVFEVFLSPSDPPTVYYEFEINPLGALFDARIESPEGRRETMRVDVSWNESWTGTEQKRLARFEDNRVYLSTPPSLDPITGTTSVRTMTWEKLG